MPNNNEIDLTPNFDALFTRFIQDAWNQGRHLPEHLKPAMFDEYPEGPKAAALQAAVLRVIQGYLAPITVAANAATSVANIERLREVMSNVLGNLDSAALALENEAQRQPKRTSRGVRKGGIL